MWNSGRQSGVNDHWVRKLDEQVTVLNIFPSTRLTEVEMKSLLASAQSAAGDADRRYLHDSTGLTLKPPIGHLDGALYERTSLGPSKVCC